MRWTPVGLTIRCARNTQAALPGGMPDAADADADADADAAWEAEQRELAKLSRGELTALQGRLEDAGWDELYDKSSEAVCYRALHCGGCTIAVQIFLRKVLYKLCVDLLRLLS